MGETTVIGNIITVDKRRAVTEPSYVRSLSSTPAFYIYDKAFSSILGSSPLIKLIESRDYQFAHEAGVYIRSTDSIYFTANFQTCDPIDLYAVDCQTHKIKKLNYPSVIQANGACNYQDKVLYCVQGSKSSHSSLVLVDPATEESTTLINNFYGREFSSINDVVVHHHTGDIWFTDPTYGYEQGFRHAPDLPSQVYRFRPSTGECWVVADGFEECNGLCFSPDYKRMYITDTGAIQAHDGVGDGHSLFSRPRKPATIYVYDVLLGDDDESRFLGNRRTFAYCDKGVPDGIKCDELGNVYSGCGDGVHVWDPNGTLIGKIGVGSTVANFCFAKGGMWILNETKLWFCELRAKGALVKIECE